MPKHQNKWEYPLLAGTAGLGIAAVSMLFSSVQYINGISRSAENNVVYEVLTTAPELARLQMTVAARFLPESPVTDDDVALRFGILENRMVVLGTAESRRLRQDGDEAIALIERMQKTVREISPRMQHLKTSADAVAILSAIEPLNTAAAQLAALTTSSSSGRIAENRAKLIGIFWQLLSEILGLLICGILLIALLRRARRVARHSASSDVLTGLPNRLSFNSTLSEEFGRGNETGSLIVMMIDLDHFKHVNDTLGHAAGDQLLSLAATRLLTAVPEALLFARLGGDEFAAIFRETDAERFAVDVAQRMLETLHQPFDLFGSLVTASGSLGIAIASPDDLGSDDLMKNADLALYAVKDATRGAYRLYHPALKQAYLDRQILASDLERALEKDELELHFQPVVSLGSGRTSGFEALLRWKHATRGRISPAEFIPIAEETGFILPIGRWVIADACATAATWPDDISIAVNLSARQFGDPQLKASIVSALSKHGLRPSRLTLEITESVLIQNDHIVLATLNDLRAIGVRISLDDFGTGYASLSYLTRFPFDAIKIDQSFVRCSTGEEDSLIIVQTICELAAKLGLSTVAEGIETEEQLAAIRATGCDEGQGYLFDRPLPASECATRIALEQLSWVREGATAALNTIASIPRPAEI
ncbi:hypothetical protein ASG43_17715 [Aureimonas sp. Leaf454]|uniref:putative bifunctional diguanylate cyclase/phosphodiesterase n=1 Tax=Aureimonas sp. Leaf454 TaxID=1736381 RepID=UPI0007003DD6|nr:EAL domain-containing protein [Aureimonas sp. Leaf454]KQT53675.1 hypothetical protein ASG43_17715 [Aureimonas sp. Leaf454]